MRYRRASTSSKVLSSRAIRCRFPVGTVAAPAVLCVSRPEPSTNAKPWGSRELRDQGYGLLCVARATGPLEAETQDEDEVYELQFGRHFGRGSVRSGLPLDEE